MTGETGSVSPGETGAYLAILACPQLCGFLNLSLPPACPLSLMPCLNRIQLLMQGAPRLPRQGRGPGL